MKLKNTFLALAGLSLFASATFAQTLTTGSVTGTDSNGAPITLAEGSTIPSGSTITAGSSGAVVSVAAGRVLLGANASAAFTAAGVTPASNRVSVSCNPGETMNVTINGVTIAVTGTASFTYNADGSVSVQVISGTAAQMSADGTSSTSIGNATVIPAAAGSGNTDSEGSENTDNTVPAFIITSSNKGTNTNTNNDNVAGEQVIIQIGSPTGS